jgi:hypothetical protein
MTTRCLTELDSFRPVVGFHVASVHSIPLFSPMSRHYPQCVTTAILQYGSSSSIPDLHSSV